ncbi:MAG: trans-sulfuration enzyme family protein [Planctomycetota bacterium]
MSESPGFITNSVHGAGGAAEGPVSTPVYNSSTYRFRTIAELAAANAGKYKSNEFYTRYGSPNLQIFEDRLARVERTETSLALSSGMAAISAVAFAYLRPGSHLIAQSEIYGGTLAFIREVLIPWGVRATFVKISDFPNLDRYCSGGVHLIFTETPTNPHCRIVDLQAVSKISKKHGAIHACDATFASPWNQNTHSLGVDLVIQSATKYIGGHSDLLGGTVAGTRLHIAPVEKIRKRTGAVPDPEQVWRMERSLKTLALRVSKQNENAMAIAHFLASQQKIERVYYPGIVSHPDHQLAKQQMTGFGGIVTFDVRGGERAATRFAEALKLVAIAPSLGGVESLICPPIHTSHASLTPEQREESGISGGMLRLSVGIEDIHDLLEDLKLGLQAVSE